MAANGGVSTQSASSSSNTVNSSSEYNLEQLEAVQRIEETQNYYELLGVDKEFTEGELKKQYRKMILQFHPDKNQAPGSEEAFKRIDAAFKVLSDGEKKQKYDQWLLNPISRNQFDLKFDPLIVFSSVAVAGVFIIGAYLLSNKKEKAKRKKMESNR